MTWLDEQLSLNSDKKVIIVKNPRFLTKESSPIKHDPTTFIKYLKDPVDTIFMFWAITVGIMSGAGMYLITLIATLILGIFYTISCMFMFKKNRVCLHDLIAGSIVINKKESFYFDSPVEERYYEERAKRKGIFYE